MKKILFACLTVLFLSACGTTKPSTFYALDSGAIPADEPEQANAGKVKIGIEPVIIPNYLNRPQIVIRDDDGVTLKISEFNRWGEQIGDVFPRVLADSMNVTFGYPAAKQINVNRDLFPYRLQVEVSRFDASFGKDAVLNAWWTLTSRDGKTVYRSRSVLTHPVGNTYADAAEAERTLIVRLGGIIGNAVRKKIK